MMLHRNYRCDTVRVGITKYQKYYLVATALKSSQKSAGL